MSVVPFPVRQRPDDLERLTAKTFAATIESTAQILDACTLYLVGIDKTDLARRLRDACLEVHAVARTLGDA